MELQEYQLKDFKDSEKIATLLSKLGVPKDLYENGWSGFWERSRPELEYLLEIIRKIYKDLCKHLHPRTLEDSSDEAAKLHSLMDEIETRFKYNISGKKLVLYQEGLVECMCGCGKSFKSSINPISKQEKKYFNSKCRKKVKNKKYYLKYKKKPFFREDYPFVTCDCGCRIKFRPISKNGGHIKKYALPRCKARAQNKKDKISGKTRQSLEYKKNYYLKTKAKKLLTLATK